MPTAMTNRETMVLAGVGAIGCALLAKDIASDLAADSNLSFVIDCAISCFAFLIRLAVLLGLVMMVIGFITVFATAFIGFTSELIKRVTTPQQRALFGHALGDFVVLAAIVLLPKHITVPIVCLGIVIGSCCFWRARGIMLPRAAPVVPANNNMNNAAGPVAPADNNVNLAAGPVAPANDHNGPAPGPVVPVDNDPPLPAEWAVQHFCLPIKFHYRPHHWNFRKFWICKHDTEGLGVGEVVADSTVALPNVRLHQDGVYIAGQIIEGLEDEGGPLREPDLAPDDAKPRVRDEDDRECPICKECYKKDEILDILPCGHRFHGLCIDRCFEKRGLDDKLECPFCTRKLTCVATMVLE
jgi:hypothetical protein